MPSELTIALGSSGTLNVQATDPDSKQPLPISVLPMPLVANASFDQGLGVFTLTPSPTQVGELSIQWLAETARGVQGQATTRVRVTQRGPGNPTEIKGVVLDSDGDAPVVGAEVRVPGTGLTTMTDAQGAFLVQGLPQGVKVIEVDGMSAGAVGGPYAYVAEDMGLLLGHLVYDHEINVVTRPIYLPKLGPSAGKVDPNQAVTLNNANAGVQVQIAAGSAQVNGAPFSGDMFLPEVRRDRTPAALPATMAPAQVVAIQPAGLTFNPPAPITFPNRDNLANGTKVDIWSINPNTGTFAKAGTGTVNGAVINSDGGVIRNASWHFPQPGPCSGKDSEDSCGDRDRPGCGTEGSSFISTQSGGLIEDHRIATHRVLGEERSLRLVYNSLAANPRPAVNLDGQLASQIAVPQAFSTALSVGGVALPGQPFIQGTRTDTRFGRDFDASLIPTGWYPYDLRLRSHYTQSTVDTIIMGGVLVQNERQSPLGCGWTVDGLQKLHLIPSTGRVLLTEGNGDVKVFTPQSTSGTNQPTTDLCFTMDGSGSITGSDFRLQLEGLASAVEDPNLIPHSGAVALAVVQFAGFSATTPIPLTRIDSAATAQNVATQIRAIRQSGGGTPMDAGIDAAVKAIGAGSPGARQVICLSTDGAPNSQSATLAAANRAFLAGIDEIDAIAVGPGADVRFLQTRVRNGFVQTASDFGTFAATVGRKLAAVINGSPPGEFSVLYQNQDSTYTRKMPDGTQVQFDTGGFLTSIGDRNGNSTKYAYDGGGRIQSIVDPFGKSTTFVYGNSNLLTAIVAPDGRRTTFRHQGRDLVEIVDADGAKRGFVYDSVGRMTSQTDKRGNGSAYAYALGGRIQDATRLDAQKNVLSQRLFSPSQSLAVIPTQQSSSLQVPLPPIPTSSVQSTITDGRGSVIKVRTDRLGNPVVATDPLGDTTQYQRDTSGLTKQVTHPNGRVDDFQYDSRGNVLVRRQAVGTSLQREWKYLYNKTYSLVEQITDPAGGVTKLQYDTNGNLLQTTDARGSSRTYTYTSLTASGGGTVNGLLATATDENGNTTRYDYNSDGLVDTTTYADGSVTKHAYDGRGNVTQITEGFGTGAARTRRFEYDSLNRLTVSVDGAGGRTEFSYDAAGNLATTKLPTGEFIQRSYDSLGRLASVSDPVRGPTSYTYDAEGGLLSRTDGLGRTTSFTYDAKGQLVSATDPQQGAELYAYRFGNVTSFTNANGHETKFGYDLFDRRTSRTSPQSRIWSWGYDSRDNLVTESYPDKSLLTHVYDELSRVTLLRVPAVGSVSGNTIQYSYDNVGNLRFVTDNDSRVEYTYDNRNRIREQKALAGGAQPVVTLTSGYDLVGNRTVLIDSVGGQQGFTHDGAGRTKSASTASGMTLALAHDGAGRLLAIGYPNGVTATYSYQAGTGRLMGVSHQKAGQNPVLSLVYGQNQVGNIASVGEANHTWSYGYDALDRLTSATAPNGPESYTYDGVGNRTATHVSALHRHNSDNQLLEDDSFSYSYDLRGNVASQTPKSGGPPWLMQWDGQDQLVGVAGVASYKYDGLGRRIEKSVGSSVVRRYVYDGDDIALEFDGSNQLLARYTHGDNLDQHLAMERGGSTYYYHADHLESVRRITDGNGAIVNQYDYDSYGQTLAAPIEGVENPFWYTGREEAREVSLYYYRARWYDPRTGRFLAEDIVDAANLYGYVDGDPINANDPMGRLAFVPALIWAFGAAVEAYGLYETYQTFSDPCSTTGDKAFALGLVAAGPAIGLAGRLAGRAARGAAGLGDDFARALDDIAAGRPRPNVRNPKPFANDGRGGTPKLPDANGAGNPITYTEHTVNPRPPGGTLDGNRIVTGSDGSVWATTDHFRTWTRIR